MAFDSLRDLPGMAPGEKRVVQDDEGGRVLIEKVDDDEAILIHEAPGAGVVLSQSVFPNAGVGVPKLLYVDWAYWTLYVDGDETTIERSVAEGEFQRVRSMEADPYTRSLRFFTVEGGTHSPSPEPPSTDAARSATPAAQQILCPSCGEVPLVEITGLTPKPLVPLMFEDDDALYTDAEGRSRVRAGSVAVSGCPECGHRFTFEIGEAPSGGDPIVNPPT